MELFTLGSGYTETDIREAARALTGLRAHARTAGVIGEVVLRLRASTTAARKTIFGQTGNWGVEDVLDLCVSTTRPTRRSWSPSCGCSSSTEPIPDGTRDRLAAQYVQSGLQLRPLVRSILEHPALYRDLDAARHGQVARRPTSPASCARWARRSRSWTGTG